MVSRVEVVAQLVEGGALELAGAGAGEAEVVGDVAEGSLGEEALADDVRLVMGEVYQGGFDGIAVGGGGEEVVGLGAVGAGGVSDEVDQAVGALRGDDVEGAAGRGGVALEDLGDALGGGFDGFGDLGVGGGAAFVGGEFGGEALDAADQFVGIDRQADDAGVGVDRAGDGLADPPVGVGRDGVATGGVEELEAADEAEGALWNEVG